MNTKSNRKRIQFGDFQTPDILALKICERLRLEGILPDTIIEPTCGLGSFIKAAVKVFPRCKQILGFEMNDSYIAELKTNISTLDVSSSIIIEKADFFRKDWERPLSLATGSLLILGNFPWVTNAVQGTIGGDNLPNKSNFQNNTGFDSISGKANFDISEWMLIEVLRWLKHRNGDIAMLVKKSVARKVISYAERTGVDMFKSLLIDIDTKKYFDASVDACLLVMRIKHEYTSFCYDYTEYDSFEDNVGRRIGHRMGLIVNNLELFENHSYLVGNSPLKWRSGVKHDVAQIMEFKHRNNVLINGLDEPVDIEPKYVYPLLKGSDIGSGKEWRKTYVLVTQHYVGEPTTTIMEEAPLTWLYLTKHTSKFDSRRSTIYKRTPRFSMFGIGEYTFLPWKIAICGLYKSIRFQLVGPIDGKPVVFDDTVYYISFDTKEEATEVLDKIDSTIYKNLLSTLIFNDEKRPIKAAFLNVIDWSLIKNSDVTIIHSDYK